jgi:hypothetical protein
MLGVLKLATTGIGSPLRWLTGATNLPLPYGFLRMIPIPLQKTNQDRIVRLETLMSFDPNS